jgi:hypothetical protein
MYFFTQEHEQHSKIKRRVKIREELQINNIKDRISNYRNKWWEHAERTG